MKRLSLCSMLLGILLSNVSIAQHRLQLDAGVGRYGILQGDPAWPIGVTTFTFPPGGGTVVTTVTLPTLAWVLNGNILTGGTPATPTQVFGSNNDFDVIFRRNALEVMRFGPTSAVFTTDLTANANTLLNGNVALGNAPADAITLNGTLTGAGAGHSLGTLGLDANVLTVNGDDNNVGNYELIVNGDVQVTGVLSLPTLTANSVVVTDGAGNLITDNPPLSYDATTNILSTEDFNFATTASALAGVITQNSVRFLHSFGTNSVYLGAESGNFTMTGSQNAGVGRRTFQNLTTGTNNAAIGFNAAQAMTTAFGSTAIGSQALFNTTTGNANTAVGLSALFANTTGSNNVAVGNDALGNSGLSSNNTAVGSFAMENTAVGNLTAVGHEALRANTTGAANVAVGAQALRLNTTGAENVGVGNSSLAANTTGSANTAVGNATLIANTTGGGNVAIGDLAMQNNTTGSTNTAVGRSAMISNTTGVNNVAMGIDALHDNTTSSGNTAIGNRALIATTGATNTAIGDNAGDNNLTGSNNTFVGAGADASGNNFTNATAIGAGAIAGASNTLILGNGANVGIGTSTPITLLANTNVNIADQSGDGLNAHSIAWQANAGGGYVVGLENLAGGVNPHGLLVKTTSGIANTRVLTLHSAGVDMFRVFGDQRVVASGSVTLGDAAADAHTINGAFDANDNGNIIGDLSANSQLRIEGQAGDATLASTIAGNPTHFDLAVIGDIGATGIIKSGASITIDGVSATRAITSDAAMSIVTTAGSLSLDAFTDIIATDDNINPALTDVQALGTAALRWDVFADNMNANSITLPVGTYPDDAVFYSNGGALAAEAALSYDDATNILKIGGGANPALAPAGTKLRIVADGGGETFDFGTAANLGFIESYYDNFALYLDADNNVPNETFALYRNAPHTGAPTQFFRVDGNTGQITAYGNFIPNTNNAFDLGSDGNRWRDAYIGGTSVHIGSALATEMDLGYSANTGTISIDGTTRLALTSTGALQRNTTGNARGATAVDLQTNRVAATQVASGLSSVIGGGEENTASGGVSTIGGGSQNVASGASSTIGGGRTNTASALTSTVGGGNGNTASGNNATVAGGNTNTASSLHSTVGGGSGNTASVSDATTVSGGLNNTANASNATVSGGTLNTASGSNSTVAGGNTNVASGAGSNVNGGLFNSAIGDIAAVLGGRGLTLDGAADGSFGYLSNLGGNDMTISAPSSAVFGNTNLWLANNTNTASQLRFYEPNATASGAFPPAGIFFAALQAPALGANYTLTLPVDDGTANQVLLTDGTGTLSWTTAILSGGAAGGDLTGTYPNPTIVNTAGPNIVAALNNSGVAQSLNADVINYDATLTVTANELGINLNNANSWTAAQTFSSVDINGGTIDGTTIGATTPAAATVSSLRISGIATNGLLQVTGGNGTVSQGDLSGDVTTTNSLVTTIANTAGPNIVAALNNSGVAQSLNADVINYDATLTVAANNLGINLANANSWTAAQTFTSVDINGGTVDGTSIGATTASTGAFTTLSASSTVTLNTVAYTFPAAQATAAGQVLSNDGTGVLSWVSSGGGTTTQTTNSANTGGSAFAANQNDLALPAGATYYRIESTGAINITGLAAGADGQVVILTNIGANNITLTHLDAGSLAANQFRFPGAGNIILGQDGTATLIYDATTAKWRLVSTN